MSPAVRDHLFTVSSIALVVVSATDLLLHPSVFSASPDADLAEVSDLNSWLDLFAAPLALATVLAPGRAQRFLKWQLLMTWPGGGPFHTPPGASTPVQPLLIACGLGAGLYGAVAALTVLMFPVSILAGSFSAHLLGRAVLRPFVAWALLRGVSRGFNGSSPAA